MDLLGPGDHVEPFAKRRASQALVKTDEAGAGGTLLAPVDGGGELQRVGGTQCMEVEESNGTLAQLPCGLHLHAEPPECAQPSPDEVLKAFVGLATTYRPSQRARALHPRAPPDHHLRVLAEDG